jgi:hypothetical protein
VAQLFDDRGFAIEGDLRGVDHHVVLAHCSQQRFNGGVEVADDRCDAVGGQCGARLG